MTKKNLTIVIILPLLVPLYIAVNWAYNYTKQESICKNIVFDMTITEDFSGAGWISLACEKYIASEKLSYLKQKKWEQDRKK